MDELTERDFEELQERAPFFFWKKVAKKAVGGAARLAGSFLSGRDFEDIDELAAREPEPFKRGRGRYGWRSSRGRSRSRFAERDLEDMDELSARDLEDLEDLATREPLSRSDRWRAKRFRSASTAGRSRRRRSPSPLAERDFEDLDELDARELEELEERFWFLKNVAKKAARKVAGSLFGRDLDDLEELAIREPNFFKKFVRKAGSVAKSLFFAREFEDDTDLSAREPLFRSRKLKSVLRGAASLATSFFGREIQDLDELSTREFEEFEERCFAAAAKRLSSKAQPELSARSVEEALGELDARDFEDDLFEAREMEIDELD